MGPYAYIVGFRLKSWEPSWANYRVPKTFDFMLGMEQYVGSHSGFRQPVYIFY